jgi:beta-lactamase regulating signal transducer with metallopeptidase domain
MLELTLRSTVILAVAWMLCRMMPRATAATRHLVWHGALLATVLAPLVSIANVPKLPIVPATSAEPVARVFDALEHATTPATQPSVTPITAATSAPGPVIGIATLSMAGSVAIALWFAAGWFAASQLSRRAKAAPAAWQLEVNALCDRFQIAREVRVKIIDQHSSPLATGLFRAAIVLPRTALTWTDDRRRAVLLHELAHIRRHDCRVQLLAQIACAIYWFNPLVWFAASELRSERERACDDHVLHFGAQASSYAAHLLDIARDLRPTISPSAALAMARPSELEGRLLSVLAAGRARVPFRATRWVVVAVLTITTVAALGATSMSRAIDTPMSVSVDAGARYVVANDVMMSSAPPPDPLPEAEATLQSSSDPDAREKATLALAFTSGRDVIPALLQALADPDAQVREKAAIGLALRRDERVIAPLIAAMSDPESQVREKAAIALGTTGDARAQEALTRALNDPDAQVREKAAAGLILFGLSH